MKKLRTIFKSTFKNTNEKIKDTLGFYKEHLLRYILIIFLFFILSFFLLAITSDYRIYKGFIHIEYICENNTLIEQKLYILGLSIDIWLTFYTILSFVIGGFFALFQYDKSNKKKQQEKGSDIFYRFSDKIVTKLSVIGCVLKNNKFIKENVLSLDPYRFVYFDTDELLNDLKIPKIKLEECKEVILSEEVNNKYKEACEKILSPLEKEEFPPTFDILISNTLNELEAVCMDISSTVAGSQFIYSSLHQIFLDTVHILYFHICIINDSRKVLVDRYYINLIYVFNEWNNIRHEDKLKKVKIEKKIENINKKKEREINKAKNKKPQRV